MKTTLGRYPAVTGAPASWRLALLGLWLGTLALTAQATEPATQAAAVRGAPALAAPAAALAGISEVAGINSAGGGLSRAATGREAPSPMGEHVARRLHRPAEALSAAAEVGRRLYLEGRRADGSPLVGVRRLDGGQPLQVQGAQAACVACHRGSGLGSVEGDVLIAPITGRALHEPGSVAAVMDTRSKRVLNTAHAPYDLASLGAALRSGTQVSGRPLHPMMPRYQLSEAEVAALDAYLATLSATWSPGVTAQKVRLATVITPDVDPAARKTAIDMARHYASRKNLGTRPGRRHMVSTLEFVLRTERQWELDVWELQGPRETWGEQLRALQAAKPVFAIASGLARDWAPVHAFCEAEQIPCWFPVTEALPAEAATGRWGLYFQAGVALEAEVMARQISVATPGTRRVLQLVDADEVAGQAARVLDQALLESADAGVCPSVQTLALADLDDAGLDAALTGLGPQDALVLWLRPAGLARLAHLADRAGRTSGQATGQAPGLAHGRVPVWLGTRLAAGGAAALPPDWRARATQIYPYELPEQRAGHMVKLQAWLSQARLPLTDEVLQSELYFAFSYLNETLGDMLQNLHRDYLIERAETMLDRREREVSTAEMVAQRGLRKVTLDLLAQQQQVRQRQQEQGQAPTLTQTQTASAAAQPELAAAPAAAARPGREDLVAQRQGTTIYPRLSLAPGQRLASKGAWVVPLAGSVGSSGSADRGNPQAEWVVP
ncbi:MAG: hypothetical protein RL722_516 [Pseudomonadota bacterium]|jgi:hypothetical protein